MKKNLFLLLFLAGSLVGCDKDNPDVDPTPEPEDPVYMSIYPSLQSLKQVSRAIVEQFVNEDRLGLFVTKGEINIPYEGKGDYLNVPSTFNGKEWSHKPIEIVDTEAKVFSYYPFTTDLIDGKKIPVDLNNQTDHLYGSPVTVNKTSLTANMKMNHALALTSFIIKKNDYQFAGEVSKIEIGGIQLTGTVDITSGLVNKTGTYQTITEECNYTLDDARTTKSSLIVLPTDISLTDGVKITVVVDGNECTYNIPETHNWEAGYEYIYTLNMRKMEEPTDPNDLELDIEYWSWYGKSDNIILGSSSSIDLRISSNYKGFGNTLTKGEAFPFGVFVQNRGSKFKGKVRMALFDGEQLVEHYQAYNIEVAASNIDGWLIPCYIDCPAGTYQLKPLFQKEGSNEWIWPRYIGGAEDEDWYYTIQESSQLPSCRSIELKNGGYGPSPTFVSLVKFNTPFTLSYTVSNRGGVNLQGEIKAVWHRTFGEFNVSWGDDGNSWADEIGRTRINVAGNVKYISGEIECKITTNRTISSMYSPIVSLYYRADGSDKWEFMRIDCDNTLQALTDTTEDRIYGEDGYLSDGLSYLVSKYPSINFCNIILE